MCVLMTCWSCAQVFSRLRWDVSCVLEALAQPVVHWPCSRALLEESGWEGTVWCEDRVVDRPCCMGAVELSAGSGRAVSILGSPPRERQQHVCVWAHRGQVKPGAEEQEVQQGWTGLCCPSFFSLAPRAVKGNGNICRVRYHLLLLKEPESSLILIFI